MPENVTDETVGSGLVVTAVRGLVVTVRRAYVLSGMFKLLVWCESVPRERWRQKGDQHRCKD